MTFEKLCSTPDMRAARIVDKHSGELIQVGRDPPPQRSR